MYVCMWQPTPRAADVTFTKIAGYVHVRIPMNQCFFSSYFWHSDFLRYGHFVEYSGTSVYGHLTSKVTSPIGSPLLISNELMQLTVVVEADWT